jgi:hypothetical protein
MGSMFCAAALFGAGCSDKSTEPSAQGGTEVVMTDAPTDDASVKSVFVTVTDVKLDGQSLSGFTKQTIDLKALTEGNIKSMVTAEMSAKTYGTLTLVLDADADANGSAPGCYVLTTDNTKYKLKSSGTIQVNIAKPVVVSGGNKATVVLDFNIRKAIRQVSDASVRYSFIADDSLQSAVRMVSMTNTANMQGTYSEQVSSGADKVIVYAYQKGSYNASTETQAQGADGIFFANAITSDEVKTAMAGGTYTLAFLEPGDYELHFAAYHLDAGSGHYVLTGMLSSQNTVGANVSDFVTLQASVNVTVSTVITGTL